MSLPRIQLPGHLSCATLGLGTMGLGGKPERDADAVKIIRHALDHGVDLFDTAEIYGDGHSEEVLGMALRDRRAKAVIASKFKPENSRAAAMIAACEASLKRLGTEWIDLYQMHWPNPAVPPEEIATGFKRLLQQGKIRAAGLSNAPSALLRKMAALLGPDFPLAASQQEYNLIERSVERAVLPFCKSRGMALLAYSPLAQGKLLTGTHAELMAKLAAQFNTTPVALALQWLISRGGVIPIPMTFQPDHLDANIAAAASPLPASALHAVDRAVKPKLIDIPVRAIYVKGTYAGKCYFNLEDARANSLLLSPSPVELAAELTDGELLKPVKVRPGADAPGTYELYEGQLRYWAWRIAHDDRLPIPAMVA